jgi:hypothetical protein
MRADFCTFASNVCSVSVVLESSGFVAEGFAIDGKKHPAIFDLENVSLKVLKELVSKSNITNSDSKAACNSSFFFLFLLFFSSVLYIDLTPSKVKRVFTYLVILL